MKNELLARAMTEIDDDLLEEARRPLPKRRLLPAVARYTAAAACFIAVFVAVFAVMRGGGGMATVSIGGVRVTEGGALEKPIEIPLTATMHIPRLIEGTEIPLHVDAGEGDTVTLEVSDGSVIVTDGGEGQKSVVLSESADIKWYVDATRGTSFDMTLKSKNRTIKLTASVDEDRSVLIVTAAAE